MGDYKFYSPDGKEIDKKEFVSFYNRSYYIGNDRVANASQSSRFTENKIDHLLEHGIKDEVDVAHILAWKIGKINHKESEIQQKFVYAKDWANAEKFNVTRYGKPFELKFVSEYIAKNIDSLAKKSKENPQGLLNELRDVFHDKKVMGLGTVYLITLLYFISKGEYPIYDRFAMTSLTAISSGKAPHDVVLYKDPPAKTSREFGCIMDNEMKDYTDTLNVIFGERAKDRDVDRALWVYGHLFKKQ